MRVLVSLEGPREGGTRAALGHLAFDQLHVLATVPDDEVVERIVDLAERWGATTRVDAVPERDLLAAFDAIREVLRSHEDHDLAAQINAGPDANLLSAAGMLACLHEGVAMHFLHEEGHTPLPVLTRAPLRELLDEQEAEELAGFPDEGIPLDRTGEHDEAALNTLKDRGLLEREGSRLVLTSLGRSYREHQGRA